MTVETTSTYAGPYPLNGIATAFPFGFKALTAAEVGVEIDGTPVASSAYSIKLSSQGGTAVFLAPPAGSTLYVVSKPDFRQGISFSNQSAFLPASHNEANDRAAVRDQVLAEGLNRAIQVPLGEEAPDLPPAAARAGGNKILAPDPLTGAITVLDGSAFAGNTGPANNTYTNLTTFKASSTTQGSAQLVGLGAINGVFFWETANAPYNADDVNVIKANSTPLTTGAWVRQAAETVRATGGTTVQREITYLRAQTANYAEDIQQASNDSTIARTTAQTAKDFALAAGSTVPIKDIQYTPTGYAPSSTNTTPPDITDGKAYWTPVPDGSAIALWRKDAGSTVPVAFTVNSIQIQLATLAALNDNVQGLAANAGVQMLNLALDARRNIFEKADITVGSYIDSNGALATGSDFVASGYIPIAPGQAFTANMAIVGSNAGYIAYYNSAKVKVATTQNGGSDYPANAAILVPATNTIRYMRFAYRLADIGASAVVVAPGTSLPAAYRSPGAVDRYSMEAAIRTGVETAVGSYNLFNQADILDNTLLNSSFDTTEMRGGFYVTNYLPLDDTKTIILRQPTNVFAGQYGIAFYDIDKVFLGSLPAPLYANTPYVSPFPTAMYARFSVESAVSPASVFAVYAGTSIPTVTNVAAIQAGILAQSLPYSDNQYLSRQMIPNVFRSITDGTLVSAPGVATTGDMPVVEGLSVIFLPGNDFGDGRAGIGFKDAKGALLPFIPAPVASGMHTPPPGAATWFVNFRLSDLGQLYVGVGNTVPSSIPTPGGGSTGDSQWIGKKWAMSGDSIVNGNLWAPTVQAKLGIGTYTNWGIGGTTMRDILADRTAADFAGLDLYGISTSTNDFGLAQTPIGSPADTPSNAVGATFWAAMRYNIETVLGWNPSMRMFMMTPLKRNDEFTSHPGGVPLKAYRDAILAAGEMYGIPVYDQYSRSGIGPQTFATFLRDERSTAGYYLHPNEVGGVLIGTQMYPWINGLGRGS